jgi:hypothetical protein
MVSCAVTRTEPGKQVVGAMVIMEAKGSPAFCLRASVLKRLFVTSFIFVELAGKMIAKNRLRLW